MRNSVVYASRLIVHFIRHEAGSATVDFAMITSSVMIMGMVGVQSMAASVEGPLAGIQTLLGSRLSPGGGACSAGS